MWDYDDLAAYWRWVGAFAGAWGDIGMASVQPYWRMAMGFADVERAQHRQTVRQLNVAEDACSTWAEEAAALKAERDRLAARVSIVEQELDGLRRELRAAIVDGVEADIAIVRLQLADELHDTGPERIAAETGWPIKTESPSTFPECPRCGRLVRDCARASNGIAIRPLPPPQPSSSQRSSQRIVDLVVADIRERAAKGEAHYGRPLRAFNGRPSGIDAYHEVLDLTHYWRQDIEERLAMLKRVRRAVSSWPWNEHDIVPNHDLLEDIERWLAPYDFEDPQPIDGHPTPACSTCRDTHIVKGDGCPDSACPDCPSLSVATVCARCNDATQPCLCHKPAVPASGGGGQ